MSVIHITKDTFKNEVANSETPVLIDFWSPTCAPCRMLSPVIDQLASEMKSAKICKINVDEEPTLAGAFGIMSIPTVVLVKGGKVVKSLVGVRDKSEFVKMLND